MNVDALFVSHPMWVRGLKHREINSEAGFLKSHPMWVRGLKPAWRGREIKTLKSHPMWVRGLKQKSENYTDKKLGRTLCGCVD